MIQLTRALRHSGLGGEALPTVWTKLSRAGVFFRRGQLAMLAAAPNGGKSMVGLVLATKLNLPTLFISADTDRHDTIIRTIACLSGQTLSAVEEGLENAPDEYVEYLIRADNVSFCFDASPSLRDIEMELRAYVEVYGQLPHLIVIDNLMDVQMEDVDEFRGYRLVLQGLHHMARDTGACVVVLHHINGDSDDGKVPPRRSIQGKVSHKPELILTIAPVGNDFLGIGVVKNRSGKSDPTAAEPIWLCRDFSRASITDEVGW